MSSMKETKGVASANYKYLLNSSNVCDRDWFVVGDWPGGTIILIIMCGQL